MYSETELIDPKTQLFLNPLITIIITTYRRKEYLQDAINSTLNQKNYNFEYEILVMCDDPESDLNEAKIYKNKGNIFFYKNKKNMGLYNNSNLGATLAKGRYISFLHDDDILYPDYLSNIDTFLKKMNYKPKCILVNRDVVGLNKNSSSFTKIKKYLIGTVFSPFFFIRLFFRKLYKAITLHEGLSYLLSNVYKAPSCGTLFEKDAFIKSGGFDQDYWPVSDYFFFLKFNRVHPIYMLRKKLACYRWLDNLSQNKSIQYSSFEHLATFFKSPQPLVSINRYFKLFKNEILYSKFLMINKDYRNEIIEKYPELINLNKFKWFVFVLYNKMFRFFHDII